MYHDVRKGEEEKEVFIGLPMSAARGTYPSDLYYQTIITTDVAESRHVTVMR